MLPFPNPETNIVTNYEWKDVFPLASPIVVIILFIIDRMIGGYLRKRDIERNWYLKVLIEPNTEAISKFFIDTFDCYQSSANILNSNSQIPHAAFIKLKAQEFGKFQMLKRKIEAEVFYPIEIRYPQVGKNLNEHFRNLEDQFTNKLDQGLFSIDNISDFHKITAQYKATLLKELYKPLNGKLK